MKLINQKENVVDEMVEGFLELYPNQYKRIIIDRGNCNGIIRQECKNPVSVVVGCGSGNDPWCIGYVGEGLADAAVIGPIYTAPSSRAVQAVTRSVPNKNGVVYICTNHAGDVLNFELASELAELEGITTRTVVVTDDVASARREEKSERRGTAGVLFVVKTAGGAASMGMNLEDVARIAAKANDNTYTFSVWASSAYDPETGQKLMELKDGMLEYGGGFSGESGLFKKPFESADKTVDTVMKYLLKEIQPLPTDEVAVLVNGFGKTSDMELNILGKRVLQNLKINEIKLHHILIDRTFSPQDSAGFSVSIMCMDEELRRCYDFPAWSPKIRGFLRPEFYLEPE
ncbi:MAG: dihydroxyacetone kinase subunit DhaK, partial [Eubacteriales bacterium]|nr:dihydroxyacetone kinase subunit DhaK [Eubacteriales bacterium]